MIMAESTNPRIAELEGTVSKLQRREKHLRRVISSAFAQIETRRDAREELESIIDKSDETEHELMLLQDPNNGAEPQKFTVCRHPKTILRRRFELALKK
jgi:hypothetical protein